MACLIDARKHIHELLQNSAQISSTSIAHSEVTQSDVTVTFDKSNIHPSTPLNLKP